MKIAVKRVYEPASKADGLRVLVDRLWPRGLTKERAGVDEWMRELAPSNELRKWFHSQEGAGWDAFRKRFLRELATPGAKAALARLRALARETKQVTLLFASKNEERNNAVVLKELIEAKPKANR